MGFGKEDGEEFGQVEVALVPVVELHVPDEFVVSGHVVVSDHAAVPLTAELHPDVSADEVVRGRGRRMRGRVGGGGGLPTLLSPWVRGVGGGWKGGRCAVSLPRWVTSWGESTRGHLNGVPSCHPPRPTRVGTEVGEDGEGSARSGGRGVAGGDGGGASEDRVRPAMGMGPSCGMG